MSFDNKVVVVTGSSSGIGKALVAQLQAEGARVYGADLHPDPSPAGASNVQAFIRTDVALERDIESLVETVLSREGRIDLFFSNAGISQPMDASSPHGDWERIVAVNQLSHVHVARHAGMAMVRQGGGHLVVTASASSFLSELTSAGYAMTKYAAFGLAEWLAFTYRARGLKVSVACPGAVWTPLIADIPYLQAMAIPVEDAARAILDGVREARFLITTHPGSVEQMQQKYADVNGYVDFLVGFREQALGA